MKTQSRNGRHCFSETLWRTFICYLRVTLIKDSDNAPQRQHIIFVAKQWLLESMKTPVFSVLKPLSLFQIENHVSDIDNWNQVRTWISLKIKCAIQQKCQWFLHVLVSSLNIVQWFLKSVTPWQLKDHLYWRVPIADFNRGVGRRAFQWARTAHKRHSFNWIVWNGEWIARPKVKRFLPLSSWGVDNDAATSSAGLLQAGSSWRGCMAVFMSHRLLIKCWTNSTVFLPLCVGKKILTWFCSSTYSLFCSVSQHWN